jgi:hypothetical protein
MTESAPGTTIRLPSDPPITDHAGNAWRLTPAGQVSIDGIHDRRTANVTELVYAADRQVWQYVSSLKLWWHTAGPFAPWLPVEGTPDAPTTAPTDPNVLAALAAITAAIAVLNKDLLHMSGTLSDQIDAATASIQADLSALVTGVTDVGAEITNLQAQLAAALAQVPAGSTINQAQVDALNAVAAGLATQASALEAMAVPPANPAPPASPPAP